VRLLESGLLTTVQDLGRFGYQKHGVTPSGAMDPVALRLANSLVGNDRRAAGLEMTLRGPAIEFRHDALIAICGADLSPEIADMRLPTWCAILVQRGSVLEFGDARWGCRAYLAISGGVAVPEIMGSRATYRHARIGGVEGRALQAGDDLPVGRADERVLDVMRDAASNLGPFPFALSIHRFALGDVMELYERDSRVRVMRGPHFDMFDERDRDAFLNEAFVVSSRSDRMGYRLTGPILDSSERDELVSSAVLTGTVQVPGGGEPIVLMADRQTTGGYPMIGQVAAADLPVLAQLKPGDKVSFEEITIERAQSALRAQWDRVQALKEGVGHASSRP